MTRPGLRHLALSGARWTLASRIGIQLITWPITILVVRWLDPSDYGLFAIAIIVTGFVALFSELGLGVALVQADEVGEDTARAACTAILALNAGVAGVIALLAPWCADWFGQPELRTVMLVLTLELVASSLAAVPQALLERSLAFRALSIAQMAGGVAGALVTLTTAWFDGGVWALVAGALAASWVRSLLLIAFHGRVVWPALSTRLRPIRALARFGSHVIAARVLWYWCGQADQLIVGRLLPPAALGCYNVASQLAMLPANKAMEAVNRVALPMLSKLRADAQAVAPIHPRLLGLVALYGFGVSWGFAAVAPEFVALALGPKWHAASLPLAVLALITPLRMCCALHNTIATAVGHPQAATKEMLLASVVIPSAVLVGALADGLLGASLAWLLVYPLVWLASNGLTCAALGRRPIDGLRPIAAPALAALLMMGAVWAVRRQLDSGLAALLMVEIAVGALTYLLALRIAAPTLLRDATSLMHDLVRPRREAS